MITPVSVTVDIGGTNTRVALCDDGEVLTDTIQRYRNAEHPGLEPILDAYLSAHPLVGAICVDMAGPVKDGVGTLTNLDWTIDARALSARTGGARVVVLNDLQAQGHSVPHLDADSLLTLMPGQPAPSDVRLVVNVGTGLNAVPVHTSGTLTLVPAAEAGHIALQARDTEELRLVDWMNARIPSSGMEEILSGRGLENLDEFIGDGANRREAATVMEAYAAGEDRARKAAKLFVRYLGRYAGDLALTTLPFGGVFLVGGVTRHLGPHLMELGFAEAFRDKGRFAAFMEQFPVHLVTDDYAALRGCAAHLHELQTATN
ncbi:ROK family protein [Sagittula stellata]|uniref:Putative glucokinase n=1 Tax=Sagittula stellata (strain ATCC 700073 / DSM 11524 / E-37) TaxID=388399 RepID=A3JYS6_SAGS3|nr:glucokinase [Sagittula stellata]EBA09629.1 putative glucokinase [Sagittula stellata E-37]